MKFSWIFILLPFSLSFSSWAFNDQTRPLIEKSIQAEDDGNYEEAIKLDLKILTLEPNSFEATNSIAGLYGLLGQFDQEILWANKAIKIAPSNINGHINLGNALAGIGDIKGAELSFMKARQLQPDAPLPAYSLALLSEQSGDEKKAAILYEKSIELDPKFENGYLNLAALYANQKQFVVALDYLNRLLIINPKNGDAIAMKRQIDQDLKKQR
ncbi:MAG: hypothetical protein RIQ94_1125 [Pseudomonadota bacterium]